MQYHNRELEPLFAELEPLLIEFEPLFELEPCKVIILTVNICLSQYF